MTSLSKPENLIKTFYIKERDYTDKYYFKRKKTFFLDNIPLEYKVDHCADMYVYCKDFFMDTHIEKLLPPDRLLQDSTISFLRIGNPPSPIIHTPSILMLYLACFQPPQYKDCYGGWVIH